jgi:hypothetical protein
MEEGPEPQEWVERSVEHHEPEKADVRRATTISAITAAVLAVFAAFGSLLSGHEANQAIIHQSQASDQWSYYQAKSTKGHIYDATKEGVRATLQGRGVPEEKINRLLEPLEQKAQKYEQEKEPIEHEARHLEAERLLELEKHHFYALGIASFQVGTVLASVSILLRHRIVWILSLFSGLVGIFFLLRGLILSA